MNFLLEIAHCPIAKAIIENPSLENPCKEIVLSQNVETISDFQVPEPWSGQISRAPLLFLSSNPSISLAEQYPLWSWSDDAITDYFVHRFGTGKRIWIRDGKYSLQKDDSYSRAVAFWASVRQRTIELFNSNVEPGIDYALSEVVHCKSKQEIGVKSAVKQCSEKYLDKVFAVSNAIIVIVLGDIANDAMKSIYDLSGNNQQVLEPVKLGQRERYIVFLPHPNARQSRTFKSVLPQPVLRQLRELLKANEGINTE
jgi:hypothetical protein